VINERWFKFIQQRNLVKRTTASSDSDSGTTTTTTTVNGQDIDGQHKKKRLAFLDILLACKADTTTGNALTLDDVQEEVDTFMFEVCTVGCQRLNYFVSKLIYCSHVIKEHWFKFIQQRNLVKHTTAS